MSLKISSSFSTQINCGLFVMSEYNIGVIGAKIRGTGSLIGESGLLCRMLPEL